MIHELCNQGSRLDVRDNNGMTPLDLASFRGHSNIIFMMFKRALVSKQITGSTMLHQACFFGDRTDVQDLLASGVDPSVRDIYSATPLHYAIFSKDYEIVQALVFRGTEIDAESYHWGTALHKAAYAGLKGIVTLLMRAGASVNAIKPKAGWTPLGLAVFNRHVELAVHMQNLALEQGTSWTDSGLLNTTEREIVPLVLQAHFSRYSAADGLTHWARRSEA